MQIIYLISIHIYVLVLGLFRGIESIEYMHNSKREFFSLAYMVRGHSGCLCTGESKKPVAAQPQKLGAPEQEGLMM